MNWRKALTESFEHVTATGGLYALEFDYCFERRGSSRDRHYRVIWSNRLAAGTGRKGCLLKGQYGTIRTGPTADSVLAVAEILAYLSKLREEKNAKLIAA